MSLRPLFSNLLLGQVRQLGAGHVVQPKRLDQEAAIMQILLEQLAVEIFRNPDKLARIARRLP